MNKKRKKKLRINYFRLSVLILLSMLGVELLILLVQVLLFRAQSEPEVVAETPEPVSYATPTPDPRRHNPYSFENYLNSNGILYYEDENYTSELGIDVSSHQTYIDWEAARDDGITFAIIRAGYRGYESGQINADERFDENMQNAAAAGMETGVYFFTQAITEAEAVEEAEYVLEKIRDYEVTGPVAIDMELTSDHDRINNLTVKEKTAIARAFVRTVRNAGYKPMIYGSASWLMTDYHLEDLQDECTMWVANYSTKALPYDFEYEIWQYHCGGIVDGIDVDVDLNVRMVPKH